MEEKVQLFDILHALKKRWMLIFLITVLTGLISGAISYYLLIPAYQSSTQLLVNQKNSENQLDTALMRSNVELINTYRDIIKSPTILVKVIDKLNLSESVDELNQSITVDSTGDSQVFTLIVENTNPATAVEIANEVSETFQQEIKGIMNVDNVSILARAEYKDNPIPVSPRPLLNIAIAIVVGLMMGIGIAYLLELLDNTLKDDHDVAAQLGLPVIGTIPMMSSIGHKGRKAAKIKKVGSETVVTYGGK
ncbi:capsular biosynthesis protein [Bacillus sp. AFS006103]|nr:capsular biosynthesis protein [Bacillus sp. AFS006103]